MSIKSVLRVMSCLLPDAMYIRLKYFMRMRKWPRLKNPRTYNEKLQWLKLHDRNPAYTRLVDKYEVRGAVAECIGEKYLIPLVGGPWSSFDEIDFDALPDQFVLKCTHDSGGLVICRDKKQLDQAAARRKIERSLATNYYLHGREWPYKHVRPRIIAEKYMEDETTAELRDYKFFCFGGEPRLLYVVTDRHTQGVETRYDFFDMDFHHLDLINTHPNADTLPAKPGQFEQMAQLARKLSQGLPQVRVDLYEVNGRVYFGELTFFHNSGMIPFEPPAWDERLGSWVALPARRD